MTDAFEAEVGKDAGGDELPVSLSASVFLKRCVSEGELRETRLLRLRPGESWFCVELTPVGGCLGRPRG
jgi:hypothetical protein